MPKRDGSDPRDPASPYSGEKVRYHRDRLRRQLAQARPRELLELVWLADRLTNRERSQLLPRYGEAFLRLSEGIGSEAFVAPWELESLLLEYLATAPTDTSRKWLNVFHWGTLAELINALRYIENEQSKRHDPALILDEMGRIAYRQFGHQERIPDLHAAVRWWSIMEEPSLAQEMTQQYGLDPTRLRRSLMGIYTYFNGDPFRLYPSAVTSFVGTELAIRRALARLSGSVATMRREVDDALTSSIAYRQSVLRKFPILRFESNEGVPSFIAPIRNLLWWRVTSGLYYDVVGLPEFQRHIGEQFERYVSRIVQNTLGWAVLPKSKYRPRGFGETEIPDVVAINDHGEIVAIIECKATKSTLAAQIELASHANIERAVDELAKGVLQIAKYEEHVRATGETGIHPRCFRLVVTLDDWIFFGGTVRRKVFERAMERARERSFESETLNAKSIILTSSANLEYITSFYSKDDAVDSIVEATVRFPEYELRSVPKELGREPIPRHRYFDMEFERLLGMNRDEIEARRFVEGDS